MEAGTPVFIMSSRKRLYTKASARLFLKCLLQQKYVGGCKVSRKINDIKIQPSGAIFMQVWARPLCVATNSEEEKYSCI